MAFIGLMGLIIWVGATNQVTGPAGIQTPGFAHAGELFTERLHWSSSALLTCASTCVCVAVCSCDCECGCVCMLVCFCGGCGGVSALC